MPTQLGYKGASALQPIDLVNSYARICGEDGGYWEDNGYAWFAESDVWNGDH